MKKKIRTYTERKPDPMDIHVGRRIRTRRAMLELTQERLADSLGITFQQVQKYERGTNRVSASRLHQFSQLLEVPISYFYESFDSNKSYKPMTGLSDQDQEVVELDQLLYRRETMELLKIYYSIKDEDKRRELYKIIKSVADTMA